MKLEGTPVFFGESCNPLARINFIQEWVNHKLIEIRALERVTINGVTAIGAKVSVDG